MYTSMFKQLVKGNPIPSIISAINFLQPSAKESLMEEYNVNSVEALAFKLQ